MKLDLLQISSLTALAQWNDTQSLEELLKGWSPENGLLQRIDQALVDTPLSDNNHMLGRVFASNSPPSVKSCLARGESPLRSNIRGNYLRRALKNPQAEVAELMLANVIENRKGLPNYWQLIYELLSQGFVEDACKLFNKNKRVDVKGILPTICLRLLDRECTHGLDKASITTAVQALVEKGLAINGAINRSNQSLLQLVCQAGNELLVQWLISEQADLNHIDCFGDSALDIACRNGHSTIVQLLIHAGAIDNSANVQPLNHH